MSQSQLDQSIYDMNVQLLEVSVKCMQGYQKDKERLEADFEASGIKKLEIPNVENLQFKEPDILIALESRASLQYTNNLLKSKVAALEGLIEELQGEVNTVLDCCQALCRAAKITK